MPRTWYSIKARASAAQTADISIHDEIGYFGITAKDFIKDLRALGPVEEIHLSIHSPGGDVLDGLAIYNVLRNHGAHITARVEGIAASMASVIAMAADHLEMPSNAFLMIHNPWGIAIGDAADMEETAALLSKMRDTAVNAYQEKTGLPREQIITMMDAETWMTGTEAKAQNFVDEVLDQVRAAAITFDNKRLLNMPKSIAQVSPPRAEDDNPVEPPAPVTPPADAPPADPPTTPVEPPAPAVDPPASSIQHLGSSIPDSAPAGFVARAVAALKSLLPSGALEPSEALGQLTAAQTQLTAAQSRISALEQEVATLKPKAQERDDLERLLADKRNLIKEASAAHGLTPTEADRLPSPTPEGSASILERFNAITDPGERDKFYRAHQKELDTAQRVASRAA